MGPPRNAGQLAGTWVHSYEEDRWGVSVFRREGFAFPPSRRSRRTLDLAPEGGLRQGVLGPSDRREWTSGTWKLGEDGRLVVRLPSKPDEVLVLQQVDADRLTLTPLEEET